MDKYLVLLKFNEVSDKVRKYREEKAINHDEISEIVNKMSESGRNIMCFLLNGQIANQRNIAKNMNISSQAVSENIKKLEHLNLVEKKSGQQNNENIITMTDLGKKVAKKLDYTIRDHADYTFGELSNEETETLFDLLCKIVK